MTVIAMGRQAVISDNGNTIAFRSYATDLIAGFVNNNGSHSDVFAGADGTVTLISHSAAGATTTGDSGSEQPVISNDGRTIAFVSGATDLVTGQVDTNATADVFAAWDGTVTLITHSPANPLTSVHSLWSRPQR